MRVLTLDAVGGPKGPSPRLTAQLSLRRHQSLSPFLTRSKGSDAKACSYHPPA